MSPKRLGILSAIVVGLFAFIFFYERHLPSTQERMSRGDVIWDINEGDFARLIVNSGGQTFEFHRENDLSWKMVKPEVYPADDSTLNSIVFDFAHPSRMGETPESSTTPDYGLMTPRAVVTIVTKPKKGEKEGKSFTLSLGRDIPGTNTTAARVKGDNEIIFVSTNLVTDVTKPEASFKSRKIFSGAEADVTALSVTRGRGMLGFQKKNGIWWLTRPYDDLADTSAVSRLVDDLLAENVSEFLKLAPTDLSGDGLTTPIYRVTLSEKKKGAQTLDIGATRSDGKSVYARANGQTFAIDSTVTDELSREADAYRETRLVRFENPDVKSLTLTMGGKTRLFTRSSAGIGWLISGKPAASNSVEDFLTALSSITSTSFVPSRAAAPVAGGEETASIVLTMTGGHTWTISVRPHDRDEVAAAVSERPQELLVKNSDWNRAVAAARRITPEPPKTPGKKK